MLEDILFGRLAECMEDGDQMIITKEPNYDDFDSSYSCIIKSTSRGVRYEFSLGIREEDIEEAFLRKNPTMSVVKGGEKNDN